MSSVLNGFDGLARYYDFLARLVFGDSIRKAQLEYINDIPTNCKVLILGGGTGWLLEKIRKKNSTAVIWYVEASQAMLEKARVSNDSTSIHFIHGTEDSLPADLIYDVVICNFYFDLFNSSRLREIIIKLKLQTHQQCMWLVSDFVNDKWWHKVMLWFMYKFFRATCNIEATQLPDWKNTLSTLELCEMQSRYLFGKFIRSSVYIKK